MTRHLTLPSRRSERRLLIVCDEVTLDRLRRDGESRHLAGAPGTLLLDGLLEPSPDDTIAMKLERQGLIVPGAVLLASPYSDLYAPLSEAVDQFAVERWGHISLLCQALGATAVHVCAVTERAEQSQTEVSAKGGKGVVSVEAAVANKRAEDLRSRLQWSDDFDGGACDADEARSLLERTGLDSDPALSALVEARVRNENR